MCKIVIRFLVLLFLSTQFFPGRAETCDLFTNKVNVYKVDLSRINEYEVIKKGTPLDLVLLNDLFTKENKNGAAVDFKVLNDNNESLNAGGIITNSTRGKRFARHSLLKLSANKLNLPDGQEVYFSAYSPAFQGVHPPHLRSGTFELARAITSLSIASSPATFGISLGASFFINGLLSAYQNGISDFFWGGLDGTGFSFLENTFRKQPDIYLGSGTMVPFVLSEDLKINKH